MAADIQVTKLNLFPIKSCRGVQVEEVEVGSHGVVDDRRFMLVDGNNRFISQRKFSKLALVCVKFVLDGKGNRMVNVSAAGMGNDLLFSPILVGPRVEVGIWNDKVMVIDQGEGPAEWFSQFIGHGGTYIRLVASAESDSSNAGSALGEKYHRAIGKLPLALRDKLSNMQVALADDGPVSLVSCESLADVNRGLKERGGNDLPLSRFRMNIEISGCTKPFEEDDWLLIKVGEVPFMVYLDAKVSENYWFFSFFFH